MADVQQFEELRPLGGLEQISACCHDLGFFKNVGLSAHYQSSNPKDLTTSGLRSLIYAALKDLLHKHRILFAIPVLEAPNYRFVSLPFIDLDRSVIFVERCQPEADASGEADEELDAILEDQHNTGFDAEYGNLPFWRLLILQSAKVKNEFTASFIFHHAIGDGVAGLIFHDLFRDALEIASATSFPDSEVEGIIRPRRNTSLLPSLEGLHPLPINPNFAPPSVSNLREWVGSPIESPCRTRWSSFTISSTISEAFVQECRAKKVSVTSALSSLLAYVLFERLPPTIDALNCIIPVNLRPWLSSDRIANNAIGTYFDATRVQLTRDCGSTDVWTGAQHVSQSINDYLCNTSASGEPFTSVAMFKDIPDIAAVFKSMLGKPRDAALEITNVGRFKSSTALNTEEQDPCWRVGKVLLSRSSAAMGAAVTISVASGGNGAMSLGFSWQEGIIEDDLVMELRRRVREFFAGYQKGISV